jgi:hypothetical protein
VRHAIELRESHRRGVGLARGRKNSWGRMLSGLAIVRHRFGGSGGWGCRYICESPVQQQEVEYAERKPDGSAEQKDRGSAVDIIQESTSFKKGPAPNRATSPIAPTTRRLAGFVESSIVHSILIKRVNTA